MSLSTVDAPIRQTFFTAAFPHRLFGGGVFVRPKHVDEGAQCSRHVAATWIVEAEPRRRWYPVIQHGDEVATRQISSDTCLPHISEASTGQCRVAHQGGFIEGQGTWRINRQRPALLSEFPAIQCPARPAGADTTMRHEISWFNRRRMVPQIGRRSDDDEAQIGTEGHRDHVAWYRIPCANAGIEALGHDVDQLCFGDV
jgi:hypothetical protein